MITTSSANFFTLFYALFCLGFVLQSREFVGVGLSPDAILSRWLENTNSEEVQFIQHHIVKSTGTLIIHLSLPLIYLIGYTYFSLIVDNTFDSVGELLDVYPPFYYCIVLATMLLVTACTLAFYWSLNSWISHPIVKKLKANTMNNTWRNVATDVNNEFRRIDKFTIQVSPLTKVVVTENWILLVSHWPWGFHLAHQSNVQLELVKSVQMALSPDSDETGGVQYLTVKVHDRRNPRNSFEIRLKSTDYRELQNRVRGSISNTHNVTIVKSVSERFIEVFKEHVEQNPRYQETEELEPCIGCMATNAEIKLIRRCDTNSTQNPCETCYCRPMWCLVCLGKWFAMRQDENRPDTWLSSKCPCPTCRYKFCIVDVSLIEPNA